MLEQLSSMNYSMLDDEDKLVDADLKTMQDCKNIIKKDGLLFLSIAIEKDIVYFNGGRVYGEHRWPLLIDGWKEIEKVPVNIEPIMVLKNI